MFLLSWFVYPTVLVVLSVGCGLLVTRAAAWPATVLVFPIGFATVISAAALLLYFPWSTAAAGPILALLAATGLLLSRGQLRRPPPRSIWPALAGLLPAATIAAPVVLTGRPGFTGYVHIVDVAFQFDFAHQLQSAGRHAPASVDSSYTEVISKMLGIGYPGGAQGALGASTQLLPLDIPWAYQPFLAVLAGALGTTLYALLGPAIRSAPLRALSAGIAAQPTILFSYALTAGIKELAAAFTLLLVAALLAERRPAQASWRQLTPVAIAIAASAAVFSLTILPWLGILLSIYFVVDLVAARARGTAIARWVALGIGTALLAAPTVREALRLAPTAVTGGPRDLGNLAAPVSPWSMAGPWFTSDYRLPLHVAGTSNVTMIFGIITLLLALVGLVTTARHRATLAFPALTAAAVVAVLYVAHATGPWIELKSYTVTAPIVLALGFAGAASLTRVRLTSRLAIPAALLLSGAVLYGNALAYHGATLAPYERFRELERLGTEYAGQGPTLYPAFEEYAEYFLRDARATSLVTPPNTRLDLRPSIRTGLAFTRDLNEFTLPFLQSFRLIIVPRDPRASRPPSNWELVRRTQSYDIWKRVRDPRSVLAHIGLTQQPPGARSARLCRGVSRAASHAGPDARVVYASPPAGVASFPATSSPAPPGWRARTPDEYLADGPGSLYGDIKVDRTVHLMRKSSGQSVGRSMSTSMVAAWETRGGTRATPTNSSLSEPCH